MLGERNKETRVTEGSGRFQGPLGLCEVGAVGPRGVGTLLVDARGTPEV